MREIQTSLRIGLPEINSWTKPIILVVAWAERVAAQEPFSDLPVATVIAKYEYRRETVQGLAVILGEFARLGIDALRDQDLSRSLTRLSCTCGERFGSLSEADERFAGAGIDGVNAK